MATLTKSTGTVTLTGAVEKVTFPAVYGWVWVKNMSDADMFVGLSESVSAGADGVMVIPAGECGRVQTDGFDFVYLLGAGNALVVAQNYADCPFKGGAKGGEIPDLSAYAKKTDIPTELPANGGNADYATNAGNANAVGGKAPEKIFYENGLSADLNGATQSGCYSTSTDTLNVPFSALWLVDTTNFNNQFIVQKAHAIGNTAITISYIRNYANNVWSDWKEISTTPIKKMTFPSVATNSGGGGTLFLSDFGTPIVIACTSRADTQCTPFSAGNQWCVLAKDAVTLDPILGSYSFDVWYI